MRKQKQTFDAHAYVGMSTFGSWDDATQTVSGSGQSFGHSVAVHEPAPFGWGTAFLLLALAAFLLSMVRPVFVWFESRAQAEGDRVVQDCLEKLRELDPWQCTYCDMGNKGRASCAHCGGPRNG